MKSTAGFWGALKRPKKFSKQSGQGMVEYILIIAVVVTVFIAVAKPGLKAFREQFGENVLSKGIFANENDGSQFYYYPVR